MAAATPTKKAQIELLHNIGGLLSENFTGCNFNLHDSNNVIRESSDEGVSIFTGINEFLHSGVIENMERRIRKLSGKERYALERQLAYYLFFRNQVKAVCDTAKIMLDDIEENPVASAKAFFAKHPDIYLAIFDRLAGVLDAATVYRAVLPRLTPPPETMSLPRQQEMAFRRYRVMKSTNSLKSTLNVVKEGNGEAVSNIISRGFEVVASEIADLLLYIEEKDIM